VRVTVETMKLGASCGVIHSGGLQLRACDGKSQVPSENGPFLCVEQLHLQRQGNSCSNLTAWRRKSCGHAERRGMLAAAGTHPYGDDQLYGLARSTGNGFRQDAMQAACTTCSILIMPWGLWHFNTISSWPWSLDDVCEAVVPCRSDGIT